MLADAPAIAAVHRASRADYYGDLPDENDGREAMWEHLLGLEDVVTHVVEVDEAMVGFMSARRVQAPVKALEMSALYVRPDHFGLGLGSRLHEIFEAERLPDHVGLLEVWQGNHRAIEFYQRRGWVETSATRPGPHDTPFITYRLDTG